MVWCGFGAFFCLGVIPLRSVYAFWARLVDWLALLAGLLHSVGVWGVGLDFGNGIMAVAE